VIGRNEQGRMQMLKMDAKLKLGVAANQLEHADRVLSQFEEFCTVTQSAGQGIPIHTRVMDDILRNTTHGVTPLRLRAGLIKIRIVIKPGNPTLWQGLSVRSSLNYYT
jgi:hypothetical protein